MIARVTPGQHTGGPRFRFPRLDAKAVAYLTTSRIRRTLLGLLVITVVACDEETHTPIAARPSLRTHTIGHHAGPCIGNTSDIFDVMVGLAIDWDARSPRAVGPNFDTEPVFHITSPRIGNTNIVLNVVHVVTYLNHARAPNIAGPGLCPAPKCNLTLPLVEHARVVFNVKRAFTGNGQTMAPGAFRPLLLSRAVFYRAVALICETGTILNVHAIRTDEPRIVWRASIATKAIVLKTGVLYCGELAGIS